jgi:hypothetical protein
MEQGSSSSMVGTRWYSILRMVDYVKVEGGQYGQ